jgi:hypothetical protein
MAEADSDEGAIRVRDLPDKRLRRADPLCVVVHGRTRSRRGPGVARSRVRGGFPRLHVETRDTQTGNVRRQQLLEHLLITARDMAEALGDFIAGQQSDVHAPSSQYNM